MASPGTPNQRTSTKSRNDMPPKSWEVFFEKEKTGACGRHIDHGVLGGTLKSTTIAKLPRVDAPQIQGHVF